MRNHKKQQGFTILELVIASSVFGLIMMVASSGIIYVGRIYYKGIIASQTQEATRSIAQEISNAFQYGNSGAIRAAAPLVDGSFTYQAYCIGKFRYSYILDHQVTGKNDASAKTIKHAMWLDILKDNGAATCKALNLSDDVPEDVGIGGTTDTAVDALSQRRELIPGKMRLTQFTLNQPASRSFMSADIEIIHGDRDLSPGNICISTRSGGHFCAVSKLSTTVKQRL